MRRKLFPLLLGALTWQACDRSRTDLAYTTRRLGTAEGYLEFAIREGGTTGGRADERKEYHWLKGQRIQHTQGGWAGLLLHGPYRSFDGDGRLREQGSFDQGLKHGEWRSWDPDGRLLRIERWRRGTARDTLMVATGNDKPAKRHVRDHEHDSVPDTALRPWGWPFRNLGPSEERTTEKSEDARTRTKRERAPRKVASSAEGERQRDVRARPVGPNKRKAP